MPKIVDHDQRRSEIISKVWRLIASDGVDAVTTRRIAEETGFANGLLRYYFPNKDAVITAALQHVFDATNARAAANTDGRGLAALRAFAVEVLPLDEERLLEARVAVEFWQRAQHFPADSAFGVQRFTGWRELIEAQIREAQVEGEVAGSIDAQAAADNLIAILMGAQVVALFSPAEATPSRQLAQLDWFIDRLRPGPSRQ